MSKEIQNSNLPAIDFSDNALLVEDLQKKYANLPAVEDEKSRKLVTAAIGDFKKLRGAIEKKRKELKSESLEWGRTLDKSAKEATEMVAEIEQGLIDLRQPYDDKKVEEERLKIEELQKAEDERIRLIQETELKQAQEREKLEAEKLKMEEERRKFEEEKNRAAFEKQALEDAKIKAEQERVENEKRNELARLQAEKEKEEQAKLAEAKRIQDEKDRLEKIKNDHADELARIEAARLEKERLEKEQKEQAAKAELARIKKEEEEKAEAERQKLLMPEKEKILEFAGMIELLESPKLNDENLNKILDESLELLRKAASHIQQSV